MDLSKIQNIQMPEVPIDYLLIAVIVYSAYSAIKRGFFREFMICLAYVPYIAALFYLFNDFIQEEIKFDSFLYKASALGAFYLAYLFLIWSVSKALMVKFNAFSPTSLVIGKGLAGVFGIARTLYFIFLCLIFFNLHINNQDMVEKSEIASFMQPYALKTQNYLLKHDYIDNEITIFEEAVNGTFNDEGRYIHPLMRKIQESDRFKAIEEKLNSDEVKQQANDYVKQYLN